MVHSMTAFARSTSETEHGHFTWEIRSVNSRYLEAFFRLPDAFRDLEPLLREQLKTNLSRGKVECSLRFQASNQQQSLKVNEELVKQLVHATDQIQAITGPGQALDPLELLQWPGVLSPEETDSKALQQSALAAFKDCLQQSLTGRAQEGAELAKLIQERLDKMHGLVAYVQENMPAALAAQKANIVERLGDLQQNLEPNRLEAEMVLLANKADVAEELDRINTHIQAVQNILIKDEPIGRHLDFMMQELNREANTLSSKSLTSGITQAAVDLKVLIEQAREQVQNIE